MITSKHATGASSANAEAVAHTMSSVSTGDPAASEPTGAPAPTGTSPETGETAKPIADGTSRQLDPRFIPLERVVGQITTAILSLVAAVVVLALVVFSSFSIAIDAILVGAWALATV